MQILDETVKTTVTARLVDLEKHFKGDVGFHYGPIESGNIRIFRDFIEKTVTNTICNRKLLIFILPGSLRNRWVRGLSLLWGFIVVA